MDPKQKEQQLHNNKIQDYIPSHAWNSTVAIAIAYKNEIHQFGTGILFRIADQSFLISASHVFNIAHELKGSIGITTSEVKIMALSGNALCTAKNQHSSSSDLYDIAIFPLSKDDIIRLDGKEFLKLTDIDLHDQTKTGVYTIFGFPAIWSEPSSAPSEYLQLRALEYTTSSYDRETDNLSGFQSSLHLLLEAKDDYLTLSDGSKTELKSLDGQMAQFPGDLGGISGCSVWRIGDHTIPIDEWGNTPAKNVAVQTSVYRRKQIIKSTRWNVVISLISNTFPELRPAINIWTP